MLGLARRSLYELSGGPTAACVYLTGTCCKPADFALDEPTSSVDPVTSTQIYELFSKLNQKMGILLISHDLTAVSAHKKYRLHQPTSHLPRV